MDTYEDDLKKIKRIGNNLFYLPIECYALEKKLRRYSHRARCYHPLITMFHADYFDPLMGYASLSENCSADYLDYLRDINGFQWIDKTLKMSQVNNLRLPVVIKSCETCSKVKGCKIVNSCKSIGNKYCRFFENVLMKTDNEKTICPECMEETSQEELDVFGGLCEECSGAFDD